MDQIRTERLLLRRARTDDLGAMHAVLSEPRAMRYWSTPPHRDQDQTRAWLGGMITAPREISEDFIIERDGVVIGKAGCYRIPDIGYILHPDHWGQGLAQEALTVVVDRVFARFDMPAITADVDPRNVGSLKLLARLGFVETGRAKATWTVGDEVCDSVYLALKRP